MSHGADRSQATPAPQGVAGDPGRCALPDRGRGPGVLVLSAEPRREACVREACTRLARHGFVAWAPAPLPVDSAPRSEAARSWADAGLERLLCEPGTDGPRVGVLAFGRAGLVALDAATRGSRVALLVCFGCSFGDFGDFSAAMLEVPLMAVLGEKDPAATRGHAQALAARLRAEGVACELRVQPGAAADFYDPGRPDVYDAVAARAGWDAALARLRAEIG